MIFTEFLIFRELSFSKILLIAGGVGFTTESGTPTLDADM
jgi:hypothetical protein